MADDLGSAKTAKAEAKAAKARAKAMRPWYKKKRWWLLGLVVIIVIAAIAGSQGGNNTAAKKTAGIGQAVRDGKFEFTVTKAECGKTRVGTKDFGKTAQGQYCFVSVTVRNIGNESQSMFGDNQILYDAQGRKYTADTEASIYVENSKAIFEQINPGNTLNGVIIYDVPKTFTPAKIELHDSVLSGGVTVNLT